MPVYVTLDRFESVTRPGDYYEVKTEGTQLSCNCMGWTRQTHYRDCPAVEGGSCSCRGRTVPGLKDARTCKHVRDTMPLVQQARGYDGAIAVMSAGYESLRQWRGSGAPSVSRGLALPNETIRQMRERAWRAQQAQAVERERAARRAEAERRLRESGVVPGAARERIEAARREAAARREREHARREAARLRRQQATATAARQAEIDARIADEVRREAARGGQHAAPIRQTPPSPEPPRRQKPGVRAIRVREDDE